MSWTDFAMGNLEVEYLTEVRTILRSENKGFLREISPPWYTLRKDCCTCNTEKSYLCFYGRDTLLGYFIKLFDCCATGCHFMIIDKDFKFFA